jgi:diketogulonate reductase-like aldo/keto reductase
MHSVKAAGVEIPALGFGTWQLTGPPCETMVAEAIRLGYRHIDTAAIYGNEVEVGRGIQAAGLPRGELFVTTKVWRDEYAPDRLLKAAETSLEKLGLQQVDLLLLHWPNDAFDLKTTLEALAETKRRGLARAIGVANFPSVLLDEAVALCPEPLATNQVEYHPYLSQKAVLAACARHGLSLTAYSPLARGGLIEEPALKAIGAAHDATPAQVALRWLIQQPGVIAIPKTASPERARANLDIERFSLTEAEMARIAGLARADGRTVAPSFGPRWDRD